MGRTNNLKAIPNTGKTFYIVVGNTDSIYDVGDIVPFTKECEAIAYAKKETDNCDEGYLVLECRAVAKTQQTHAVEVVRISPTTLTPKPSK